jgi:cell division transport system permease protein
VSAASTRVLDTARTGRGMVWVIAVMLFLTVLATAGGIGTARATGAIGVQLGGRATVQVAAADPARRERDAGEAAAVLAGIAGVSQVRVVPRAEIARLLSPWLGGDAADVDLPIPAMVDLTVADEASVTRVRRALAAALPGARLDLHSAALAPVRRFLTVMSVLGLALVAMMVAATAFVVVLAARAGLEAHRGTIEVMHMLGATDVQVARLFQRRLSLDAALGAAVGGVAGLVAVALLGAQASALGSELLGAVTLGGLGWGVLLVLPFAFVALAAGVARRAVVRSVGQML